MVSDQRADLAKMRSRIEQLENAAHELSALGQGVPVVEKNTRTILAAVRLLKFGISDVVESETQSRRRAMGEVKKVKTVCRSCHGGCGVIAHVQDGKVVKAVSNNTRRLNEILDTDPGARYAGEFSLGFNPYILSPMCDILFDEKIAGSLHLTPGQAYEECDNGNRSAVHWDMVLIQRPEWGGGEVWFDDELIRKNGLFVPRDLKPLNPANLK